MELKDAIIKSRFYCAQQERSKFELRQKFAHWGINEHDASTILFMLEKENFLSEQRFATLFVKSKINQKKWGRLKIKAALARHQIDPGIVDEAILQANNNDIIDNLKFLAEKKRIELKDKKDKNQDKIKRFLYSKGYEPELIIKYLNCEQ